MIACFWGNCLGNSALEQFGYHFLFKKIVALKYVWNIKCTRNMKYVRAYFIFLLQNYVSISFTYAWLVLISCLPQELWVMKIFHLALQMHLCKDIGVRGARLGIVQVAQLEDHCRAMPMSRVRVLVWTLFHSAGFMRW